MKQASINGGRSGITRIRLKISPLDASAPRFFSAFSRLGRLQSPWAPSKSPLLDFPLIQAGSASSLQNLRWHVAASSPACLYRQLKLPLLHMVHAALRIAAPRIYRFSSNVPFFVVYPLNGAKCRNRHFALTCLKYTNDLIFSPLAVKRNVIGVYMKSSIAASA
jgi:hypothetical protein